MICFAQNWVLQTIKKTKKNGEIKYAPGHEVNKTTPVNVIQYVVP